jgi:hypothetical protein
MANPDPSANSEQRKGDSAFLPVVIAAGIALIVILAVAAFISKKRAESLYLRRQTLIPTLSKPAPDLAPPSKVEVSIDTPLYFAFTGGSFNLPTISVP